MHESFEVKMADDSQFLPVSMPKRQRSHLPVSVSMPVSMPKRQRSHLLRTRQYWGRPNMKILFELVKRHGLEIEDGGKHKKTAYNAITHDYIAQTGSVLTIQEIKDKWNIIKRMTLRAHRGLEDGSGDPNKPVDSFYREVYMHIRHAWGAENYIQHKNDEKMKEITDNDYMSPADMKESKGNALIFMAAQEKLKISLNEDIERSSRWGFEKDIEDYYSALPSHSTPATFDTASIASDSGKRDGGVGVDRLDDDGKVLSKAAASAQIEAEIAKAEYYRMLMKEEIEVKQEELKLKEMQTREATVTE